MSFQHHSNLRTAIKFITAGQVCDNLFGWKCLLLICMYVVLFPVTKLFSCLFQLPSSRRLSLQHTINCKLQVRLGLTILQAASISLRHRPKLLHACNCGKISNGGVSVCILSGGGVESSVRDAYHEAQPKVIEVNVWSPILSKLVREWTFQKEDCEGSSPMEDGGNSQTSSNFQFKLLLHVKCTVRQLPKFVKVG